MLLALLSGYARACGWGVDGVIFASLSMVVLLTVLSSDSSIVMVTSMVAVVFCGSTSAGCAATSKLVQITIGCAIAVQLLMTPYESSIMVFCSFIDAWCWGRWNTAVGTRSTHLNNLLMLLLLLRRVLMVKHRSWIQLLAASCHVKMLWAVAAVTNSATRSAASSKFA